MQTLDHSLAPIKLQIKLVEVAWDFMNGHICLVILSDIFERLGQNLLDGFCDLGNWLLEVDPKKLLDLWQFFSTKLLEILLAHLLAVGKQVYFEFTQLYFLDFPHLLQLNAPLVELQKWSLAVFL